MKSNLPAEKLKKEPKTVMLSPSLARAIAVAIAAGIEDSDGEPIADVSAFLDAASRAFLRANGYPAAMEPGELKARLTGKLNRIS